MNTQTFPFPGGTLTLEPDQGPRRLYIELTNRCNFSCRMCFRNNFSRPFGMMDDQTMDALLQQIRTLPALSSALIGGIGEPLLHPRALEVISALAARGVPVDLQTNGTLLSENMIDTLVTLPVERIITSYECGAVGHVQATTLKETIARIARRRALLGTGARNRPRITLEWILTRDSLERLESEALELITLGVGEFIISNLLPMDEAMAEDTLIFSDATGPANRIALKNSGDILESFVDRTRYKATVQRPEFHLQTERACPFIDREALVIRYDGQVAPCYRLLHESREYYQGRWRETKDHSFGSIGTTPILELWNSRSAMWFRHTVRTKQYPSCPDCRLRDGCEYIKDTTADCFAYSPSCADCLWDRRILICP